METRIPLGKENLSLVDRFGIYLSLLALKKHLPTQPDLEILELGCGYQAKLLCALQDKIKKGVGVDFHIDTHLKQTYPKLHFIEKPIEEALPQLTPHVFHVVMLISVLEHLQEPAEVLKKCHQLLQANGTLLINVPTWRGKFFLEFSAFKLGTSHAAEIEDHKMYYDKRDLWPLLIQAGFKPSQISLKYHKFGLNLFAIAKKSD